MSDKMQKEFEVAFCKQFGFGRMAASSNADAAAMLKCAEWAWQASRESLVVELPEGMTLNELRYGSKPKPDHERLLPRDTCVKAIESLGLRVKP